MSLLIAADNRRYANGPEIWKPIEGYKDFYEVSNYGFIKRLTYKKTYEDGRVRIYPEKILSPYAQPSGHVAVFLNDGLSIDKFYVHRLVAIAFILKPKDKTRVNHIDGNPGNNHVDNLEWVTPSEDLIHAYDTGLRKGRGPTKCYS